MKSVFFLHVSITKTVRSVDLSKIDFVEADSGPPVIPCPSDVSAATVSTNAVVTYQTRTAADNEIPTVDCEPPSGSVFGIGENNVTCIVQYISGNEDTCHFEVKGKCDRFIICVRIEPVVCNQLTTEKRGKKL